MILRAEIYYRFMYILIYYTSMYIYTKYKNIFKIEMFLFKCLKQFTYK